MRRTIALLVVATLSLSQYACAPLVVAGAAAGTTTAVVERRTAGAVLEDQTIELKVADKVEKDEALRDTARIRATSYNTIVLLTGEAPNENLRNRAAELARSVEKVSRVHNEITIGEPKPFQSSSNDTWITTKVKTALTREKNLNPLHVKVVTEKGTVFLMGIVTHSEGERAAILASQVKGVQRVVKIFEFIEEDKAQ